MPGDEHKEAYEKAFPKALQRLKELCRTAAGGPFLVSDNFAVGLRAAHRA